MCRGAGNAGDQHDRGRYRAVCAPSGPGRRSALWVVVTEPGDAPHEDQGEPVAGDKSLDRHQAAGQARADQHHHPSHPDRALRNHHDMIAVVARGGQVHGRRNPDPSCDNRFRSLPGCAARPLRGSSHELPSITAHRRKGGSAPIVTAPSRSYPVPAGCTAETPNRARPGTVSDSGMVRSFTVSVRLSGADKPNVVATTAGDEHSLAPRSRSRTARSLARSSPV